MLFLQDIETFGSNKKQEKEPKLKMQRIKKGGPTCLDRLFQKTSMTVFCSKGEIAVMESLAKNDVKRPLDKTPRQKVKVENKKPTKRVYRYE